LDFAQSKQLLVVFVLWNGAVRPTDNALNLIYDETKLQTYIDNALKVFVTSYLFHYTSQCTDSVICSRW
jgi:mannan endo-1,4-beta-mannosidase